nr:sigma factor [Fodinicola feengrottensis]
MTDLAQVFRDHHGRVLARLISVLGDFDLAEDSLSDAYATAAAKWPANGVPASPGGWLVTTARRRAIDRIRRDRTYGEKVRLLAATPVTPAGATTTSRSPMTGCCFSSPVAIRRWPGRLRWH